MAGYLILSGTLCPSRKKANCGPKEFRWQTPMTGHTRMLPRIGIGCAGFHRVVVSETLPPGRSRTMNTTLQPMLALLGRILVSVIFLLSGAMKVMDWSGTLEHMAAQGLPASSVLLSLATLAEIAGGLALLLGWQTRFAAFMLF